MSPVAPARRQPRPEGARGAKSIADVLKSAGINASRASLTLMEPEALTLIRDRAHPLYDPRVELAVEVASPLYQDILLRGVEKPLDVRRNGVDKKERPILQVIDGRQRAQILLHINAHLPEGEPKRKLPVNFVNGSDAEMVLRGLSSNLLRVDETPFTKAVKMSHAQRLGCSHEEIARACNLRDTRVIEQHLLILNFISDVQEAFNGTLGVGAISVFAKVPREEQPAVLQTVLANGVKTKADVKRAAKAARNGVPFVPTSNKRGLSRDRMQDIVAELLVRAKGARMGSEEKASLTGAAAMLDFCLGNREALKVYPELSAVAEATDRG